MPDATAKSTPSMAVADPLPSDVALPHALVSWDQHLSDSIETVTSFRHTHQC